MSLTIARPELVRAEDVQPGEFLLSPATGKLYYVTFDYSASAEEQRRFVEIGGGIVGTTSGHASDMKGGMFYIVDVKITVSMKAPK